MKCFAVIFPLLFAFTAPAATNEAAATVPADAHAIMQNFQKKAAASKTIYMEFTQERVLKMFSDPLVTAGVMLIAQPDKIRGETTAPYQTIMLGGNKTVAQFEFNDGRWERLKLGFPQALEHVMKQMAAMNQGKMEAMLADFTISATTDGETVLTMVPKNENIRSVMASMEIHLPPDLSATREVIMNEPNGDFTRITFHNEKHDVEFPAGTFDQNQPLDIAAVQAATKNAP